MGANRYTITEGTSNPQINDNFECLLNTLKKYAEYVLFQMVSEYLQKIHLYKTNHSLGFPDLLVISYLPSISP